MNYFEKFPKVKYNLHQGVNPQPLEVTNVLARTAFRKHIFTDTRLYYNYNLQEYNTPEYIANEYYRDPNRHWIVMQANKVVDPIYDWVLDDQVFSDYIIGKYGSIETAQTTVHHYVKTVTKTDSSTGNQTEFTYTIDETTYNNLPEYDLRVLTLTDGSSVTIETRRDIVYCYDWENEENEKKRTISLIDKIYVAQIEQEHENLMKIV